MPITRPQLDQKFRELNEDWFEYIFKEIVSMHSSRQIFKETIEIIQNNQDLQNLSKLFVDWFAWNYATAIALRVRKLIDEDSRTKSFINFLKELKNTPEVIDRTRWVAYGTGTIWTSADLNFQYDRIVGAGRNFPDPNVIQSDIETLRTEGRKIKEFVDQHVAHHDRNPTSNIPTFNDVDDVFLDLEEMLKKYYLLFRGASFDSAIPTIQHNWKEIFYYRWLNPPELMD